MKIAPLAKIAAARKRQIERSNKAAMPKIDAWELYRKASIGHYGTERYDEFARLIIEQCAKACEQLADCPEPMDGCTECAAAIRSMKP